MKSREKKNNFYRIFGEQILNLIICTIHSNGHEREYIKIKRSVVFESTTIYIIEIFSNKKIVSILFKKSEHLYYFSEKVSYIHQEIFPKSKMHTYIFSISIIILFLLQKLDKNYTCFIKIQ